MAPQREILSTVRDYVTDLFSNKLDPIYVYHNLEHTEGVVNAAREIGLGNNLSADDLELLELAAWFHDTGYVNGFADHETVSVSLMRDWLRERNFSEEGIATIGDAIMDTRMPPNPKTKLGEMLADADMNHLGRENYFELASKLRKEWEQSNKKVFTEIEWLMVTRQFMTMHSYHTSMADMTYSAVKAMNLAKLETMIEEIQGSDADNASPAVEAPSGKKGKKKSAKKKVSDGIERPEKGIETMFRVTLKNHISLSQIADNKANIMLSINAIIISIVISALVPKIDSNPTLLFPMIIMLMVCVVSIVFATISTIPKITANDTKRADIAAKKTNLLFFGNFHDMSLEDYQWGMHQVMEDREYLYNSMIKDLYFLGKVLHKKYKYLRITYTVFMIGIILSVIAFVGSFAGWFGEWAAG